MDLKPHLVMPMGGAGSRFFKNGYMQPKPLIEINGKPFFYWSTMSVMKFVDLADLTFVVLKEHVEKYDIDREIYKYFPNAFIEVIPTVLPGPVFTSLKGVEKIRDDTPIIINDCDHMFCCREVYHVLNHSLLTEDGALLTFESKAPQFSYVQYSGGVIVGTVEKKVASNHAICGAYIFKNVEIFRNAAKKYIKKCPYNECFMSGIYNILCDERRKVKDYLLDFHVEFGTPDEYEAAKSNEAFTIFE